MKRISLALAIMLAIVMWSSPVAAETVGVAVDGYGSSNPVGLAPAADGTIEFFILLNGTGSYGAPDGLAGDGYGTHPDQCTINGTTNTCTGGTLELFLEFEPIYTGPSILSLFFNDLDIDEPDGEPEVNNPFFLLEWVEILDESNNSLAFVDNSSDPEVASANNQNQRIEIAVNVTGTYYARLELSSYFLPSTPYATYQNTSESVRATIRPISEPTTLSLLGLGLIVLAAVVIKRTVTSPQK